VQVIGFGLMKLVRVLVVQEIIPVMVINGDGTVVTD
jgi:hypothetical protein